MKDQQESMKTTTQTPKPNDPNHDFTVRLLMLREADHALFEGATKAQWQKAAITFFAVARIGKLKLVDFKPILQ
jgi:hypothetical protein